jgi:hypothetical protein
MVSVATRVAGKGGWPVGWGAYLPLYSVVWFLSLTIITHCHTAPILYRAGGPLAPGTGRVVALRDGDSHYAPQLPRLILMLPHNILCVKFSTYYPLLRGQLLCLWF